MRPEVQRFAEIMERKLAENDHKPGWKSDTPRALYARLLEEATELNVEIQKLKPGTMVPRLVAEEAADVANFAMMVADVCGGLRGWNK